MKNKKALFLFMLLIIIKVLEIFKYNYFKVDYSLSKFIIEILFTVGIFVIGNLKLKEKSFSLRLLNSIMIITSIISLIFYSFNSMGMILLYFFVLLISLGVMVFKGYSFEISLVAGVSVLILLFTFLGIIGLLKYSYLFLLLLIIFIICYLWNKKGQIESCIKSVNKKSIIILTVLFLVASLCGVGRYVHKWDEYSYWGYAAKVTIDTSSLKDTVSYTGDMSNYPPVSSIWHYIASLFLGYSEPNMYISLMVLNFIFMTPIFMKITSKNKKSGFINEFLLVLVSVTFPLLFDGSISYGLLYVDFLLGLMCATVLILNDYFKEKKQKSNLTWLILFLITLLKPQGFIYSCTLLFLFFLEDVMKESKFSFKNFFYKIKSYILPVILVFIVFIGWNILSNHMKNGTSSYLFSLLPDTLKTDIMPKLNIDFLINYFGGLVKSLDESILYSFINIPLFVFLIIIFSIIYFIKKKEVGYNGFRSLVPYVCSYFVFFVLIALSLFVMFSYYEASELASFSRYLNPMNIAIVCFILYKTSYLFNSKGKEFILLSLVVLIGFRNLTFFVTDVQQRRETQVLSKQRTEKFSTVVNNTSELSRIFVLNQSDEETIMPLWYARYYCYPRIINVNPKAITWKIKTDSNEWDLNEWGLTLDTFQKHLIDYNFEYLFLYSSTDELYEKLEKLVVTDDIRKYTLFKIKFISDNNIELIPVA